MSSGATQKSYTSLNRQQQIYSDISLIIKLISCFKKGQKTQGQPQNIENAQGASSLSLINQSSFSNNHSSFSAYDFGNFYPSYKQYGKKFHDLTYSDLLYLLCRKKLLNEFIMEFIEDKYNEKKVEKLHYKVVENFRVIMEEKQPQISLSECLNRQWSEILSKEDIFEDAVQLLGWNISKNWRLNNIKIQKKIQKSQTLPNQESKIFQTEPSLQTLIVNPSQTTKNQLKNETRKKVIEESTRHILSGLEQLKKEMCECQAQMNMAKDNDEKIVQKGKQYSKKMREYNQLKEVYRKRTLEREKAKLANRNSLSGQKFNDTIADKSQKTTQKNNKYANEFMGSENELSKINQEGNESIDKEQPEINDKNLNKNDFNEDTPIYPKKNTKQLIHKRVQDVAQNNQLSVSVVLQDQNLQVKAKWSNKNLPSGQSNYKQPLRPQQCDELIKILDLVRKNQLRDNRIKTLTNQKDSTPLEILKLFKKKPLSIDVSYPDKPYQIEENAQQESENPYKSPILQPSPTKSFSRSPIKSMAQVSPKQYLLQNYVKKVFNHYIMEQSKMKTIHLFDSSLSGSQLGYNSLISHNVKGKHRSILSDVSPHLRKKFSAQVNDHSIKGDSYAKDILQQRRRKSQSYGIDQSNQISNKKMNQNNRTRTLTNSIAIKKAQPQLTIESYSKFIRAFELANKTVTFNDVIKLFKEKSQNKKTIVYDQFIELFEQIYRLQCQKLQVQFTPLLFDAYLRKQVFDWNKINKVLRIKTVDNHPQKGQLRYNNNENPSQSTYKPNFVGHSGMLTQDLVEKINASKKPFTKMPCMNQNPNRFKTLPTNVSEQLPQTKIQQKVQEIKRLRELQKAKKAYELEQYLREARQRDQTFMTIKDELRQKTEDSYAVRFKNLESKRKQVQQKKKHKINAKNSIINETKLKKQFRVDTIGQDQINEQRPIKKSIFKKKKNESDVHLENENDNQNDNKVRKQRHRTKTMKTSEESFILDLKRENQGNRRNSSHFSNLYGEVQNELNSQKRKQRQDIMELQKIIGLRESQDQYEDEYENQFQDEHDTKKSNYASLNYSQVTNQPGSKPQTTIMSKNPLLTMQTEIANKQPKPKQNKNTEEDQYLASYLKKQSFQMDQMNTVERDGYPQRDWLKNNDRQNWRVHF